MRKEAENTWYVCNIDIQVPAGNTWIYLQAPFCLARAPLGNCSHTIWQFPSGVSTVHFSPICDFNAIFYKYFLNYHFLEIYFNSQTHQNHFWITPYTTKYQPLWVCHVGPCMMVVWKWQLVLLGLGWKWQLVGGWTEILDPIQGVWWA